MRVHSKIWFTDDKNNKFFGKGPYDLLQEVRKTGSLNQAAKNLKMSYSKAFHVMKRSEKIFGKKLLHSEIGGVRGGGSSLTQEALTLMEEFERANREMDLLLDRLSTEITDEI